MITQPDANRLNIDEVNELITDQDVEMLMTRIRSVIEGQSSTAAVAGPELPAENLPEDFPGEIKVAVAAQTEFNQAVSQFLKMIVGHLQAVEKDFTGLRERDHEQAVRDRETIQNVIDEMSRLSMQLQQLQTRLDENIAGVQAVNERIDRLAGQIKTRRGEVKVK